MYITFIIFLICFINTKETVFSEDQVIVGQEHGGGLGGKKYVDNQEFIG